MKERRLHILLGGSNKYLMIHYQKLGRVIIITACKMTPV